VARRVVTYCKQAERMIFWPRVINFVIFAAILYYLLANPIKNFFKNRKEDISSQLKEIEAKLKAAKDAGKDAQSRLDESKRKAELILEDAKKEAEIMKKKIAETNMNELAAMEKQLEEKMTLEERKSVRESIDEILGENITSDDIMVDEAKVVDIITKKVA